MEFHYLYGEMKQLAKLLHCRLSFVRDTALDSWSSKKTVLYMQAYEKYWSLNRHVKYVPNNANLHKVVTWFMLFIMNYSTFLSLVNVHYELDGPYYL